MNQISALNNPYEVDMPYVVDINQNNTRSVKILTLKIKLEAICFLHTSAYFRLLFLTHVRVYRTIDSAPQTVVLPKREKYLRWLLFLF